MASAAGVGPLFLFFFFLSFFLFFFFSFQRCDFLFISISFSSSFFCLQLCSCLRGLCSDFSMYLTQLEELFENDGSGQPKAKNGNRPITDFVGRGQSPAVASALQYSM